MSCKVNRSHYEDIKYYFVILDKLVHEKRIIDKYYITVFDKFYFGILIENVPKLNFNFNIDILFELKFYYDNRKTMLKICYLDNDKIFHSYLITKKLIGANVLDSIKLRNEVSAYEYLGDPNADLIKNFISDNEFRLCVLDFKIEICTQVLQQYHYQNMIEAPE